MSSSRRAQDTSQQTPPAGLKLTLPVLVTASVLLWRPSCWPILAV